MKFGGSWVLDAGIAAKWFLKEEPLADQATELLLSFRRGRTQLLAPDLFWPEFGNVLWKAVRQERISALDATRAIAGLNSGIIPTVPTQPVLESAFFIAQSHGRTVYHAIYIALAIESGREMLTADERLVNALGSRYPVRWLGSLT